MMSEIGITWDLFGKLAAAIALIAGFIKGVQYLNSLTPTAKLEMRVTDVEKKQRNDYEHFKELDSKVERLEQKSDDAQLQIKEVNEGIQRIGKSQIALLRHFATGNGQKEMADEAQELTEWFIDR